MNDIHFLNSAMAQFRNYKSLADRCFLQLQEADFGYRPNEACNCLATIITHLHGNMISRWTDFLTEDGEKIWRDRDQEFIDTSLSKVRLLELWEEGWQTVFDALEGLRPGDLDKIVYIRAQPLTVLEAIHRQMTHYASHVGQIIYISKMRASGNWKPLTIAVGKSADYNERMRRKGAEK
ncbi:DUF1572 family protein [Niabella terrae]